MLLSLLNLLKLCMYKHFSYCILIAYLQNIISLKIIVIFMAIQNIHYIGYH